MSRHSQESDESRQTAFRGQEMFNDDDGMNADFVRYRTTNRRNESHWPSLVQRTTPRRSTSPVLFTNGMTNNLCSQSHSEQQQHLIDFQQNDHRDGITDDSLNDTDLPAYPRYSIASLSNQLNSHIQDHLEFAGPFLNWNIEQDIALLDAHRRAEARIRAEIKALSENLIIYTAEELNGALPHARFTDQSCRDRYTALVCGTALPSSSALMSFLQKSSECDAHATVQADQVSEGPYEQQQEAFSPGEGLMSDHGVTKPKHMAETDRTNKQYTAPPAKDSPEQAVTQVSDFMQVKQAKLEALNRERRQRQQAQAALHSSRRPIPQTSPPKSTIDAANQHHPQVLADTTMVDEDHLAASVTALVRGVSYHHDPDLEEPIEDPRDNMHRLELLKLQTQRGLGRNRDQDSKPLITRRLREHDRMASIATLHKYLRQHQQPLHGTRPELIARLAEADLRSSRFFRPRHIALLNRARLAAKAVSARTSGPPQASLPSASLSVDTPSPMPTPTPAMTTPARPDRFSPAVRAPGNPVASSISDSPYSAPVAQMMPPSIARPEMTPSSPAMTPLKLEAIENGSTASLRDRDGGDSLFVPRDEPELPR